MKRLLRWIAGAALALLGLLAALCVAAYLWNPDGAVLVAAALLQPLLANTHPPPVVEGIAGWQDKDELTRGLQRKFPAGTSEQAVKTALLGQGFAPPKPPPQPCLPAGQPRSVGQAFYSCPARDAAKTLEYRWSNFPCGETITVSWTTANEGAIDRVEGHYSRGCL